MKRLLLITFTLLCVAIQLSAAPVSKEQARKKAAAFLATKGLATSDITLAKTAPRKAPSAATAAYYVFNTTEAQGFVIISGDDRTEEILGYADQGAFDESEMPSHVKAWLDGYADQIEAIDAQKGEPAKAPTVRAAIAPMLETQWNQDAPYNDRSPIYRGDPCYTGCVATAMAQIVYHNKWPKKTTSTIPAYTTTTCSIYMPYLSTTTFDYDAMPLSTEYGETNDAVAKLMLYIGQAAKMDYTPNGSGASTQDALGGMQKYFDYDANAAIKDRSQYTINDWHNLVYKELQEGRPVYYAGNSSGGGHAFVCDGYDGNGLYHINWGWGGSYDGFFRLEVLNPYGGGIGSSTTEGGYSYYQECIVGLQKSTGAAAKPLYLTAEDFSVSGTNIVCGIRNLTSSTGTFDIGWGIMKDDGTISTVLTVESNKVTLDPGWGWSSPDVSVNVTTLKLTKGTYKIVPMSKESSKSTWASALPKFSYAEVEIGSTGNVVKITKYPTVDISVTSFEWPKMMIAGASCNVTLNISNRGNEYNGQIHLLASQYTGGTKTLLTTEGAYIEKDGNYELTMYPVFKNSGSYTVYIATDEDGNNIIGQAAITVMAAPTGASDLTMEAFTIEHRGGEADFIAVITNNSSQVYASPLMFYNYGNEASGEYLDYLGSTEYRPFIKPGETVTITHKVTGLKAGWVYIVSCYYETAFNSYYYDTLGDSDFLEVTAAGVDNITADKKEDSAPYYTLGGVKVEKPTKNGLYIHKGKKVIYK